MVAARIGVGLCFLAVACVPVAVAQSDRDASLKQSGPCSEAPNEDALVSTCVPASFAPIRPSAASAEEPKSPTATIDLNIPISTPLCIAVDQRARIKHVGAPVHGRVVEPVYAFDQVVIPAGSVATGHVISIDPVSAARRALAYSDGNFTPLHKYHVTFDTLTLPDGRQLPIKTTASAGTAEVVHLVSNPGKQKQKTAADLAKDQATGKIQEAKDEVHNAWQGLTSPGKMHRLKEYLLAQSPYRRQFLEPGTRFTADLDLPLDFGDTTRTQGQLAQIGMAPGPDSTLEARLVAELSSATAKRGTQVQAVLTKPLYSLTHELVLPANTRLVGQVIQAQPARKLHHNGELRVIFERIEIPEEATQALERVRAIPNQEIADHHRNPQQLVGNLEGMEVDRRSNIKLDEEGGARTTDSKTRYLSTGLAILIAAAAAHPDAEHGTVDAGGDPGVRTAAGGSGFRLVGAVLGLAVKSTPLSIAMSTYGASSSIYANFLSRGRDVVLPKDTALEISFGPPHPAKSEAHPVPR